ncbi:MAG: DUF4321 domain-containing protein [Desulfotomaculum sp.]|nr:DUF4321 domain-containing protein [Desulfotomaculum sp.]
MARALGGTRSAWLLLLLLMAGGVAGSAVGAALSPFFPAVKNFFTIGLKPTGLSLHFFSISFGFHLAVGPFTALGMFLGYIAFRKL